MREQIVVNVMVTLTSKKGLEMASYSEVAERWKRIALGLETKKGQLRNDRMPARGDSIFSYGSHFEIARLIRDKKNQPSHWLLNGDRFSNTTTKHQAYVLSALSYGQAAYLPRVTIPHQALVAAGIDFESIRIIEVTSDGWETINVVKHEFPEGAVWKDDKIVDVWERSGYLDTAGNVWVDREFFTPKNWWSEPSDGFNSRLRHKLKTLDKQKRGYHYGVIVPEQSHTERNLYVSSRGYDRWKVSVADDGTTTYTRTYTRHWLGASVVEANVRYLKRVKCDSCNGSGKAAEPWRNQWAVSRWEWKHADWVENHVEREANAAKRLEEYIASKEDRPWTLEYLQKEAQPEPEPVEPAWHTECERCGGAKKLPQSTTRKAVFLSGFDANEARPSYFFCELPRGVKPKSVAEAYEALKPEAVRLAEQMDRTVLRQGDIFAIETNLTRRDLKTKGARFEKRGPVFRTNHAATETVTLPDGTTLGRGTLRHVPEGRRPDHRMVKLGDGKSFWVLQKNLVPTTR